MGDGCEFGDSPWGNVVIHVSAQWEVSSMRCLSEIILKNCFCAYRLCSIHTAWVCACARPGILVRESIVRIARYCSFLLRFEFGACDEHSSFPPRKFWYVDKFSPNQRTSWCVTWDRLPPECPFRSRNIKVGGSFKKHIILHHILLTDSLAHCHTLRTRGNYQTLGFPHLVQHTPKTRSTIETFFCCQRTRNQRVHVLSRVSG